MPPNTVVENFQQIQVQDKPIKQENALRPDAIYLQISSDGYRYVDGGKVKKVSRFDHSGKCKLVNRLKRCNTEPQEISVQIEDELDENIGAALYQLCQVKTGELLIWTKRVNGVRPLYSFPQLDFSTLLVMAANIRDVYIDSCCENLSGMDLCILWKTLSEGNSKLESFAVGVKNEVIGDFAKACFGITFETKKSKVEAEEKKTIQFKIEPTLHPAKLYTKNNVVPGVLYHFSNVLKTGMGERDAGEWRIGFERITGVQKSNQIDELIEIVLNHVYDVSNGAASAAATGENTAAGARTQSLKFASLDADDVSTTQIRMEDDGGEIIVDSEASTAPEYEQIIVDDEKSSRKREAADNAGVSPKKRRM